MRIGSLCSGYEGIGLALQNVFPDASLAFVSDIDKGACKLLAHRYPDVPNLGDFTRTDWATVEPVDVLTAGFPCQPVSHAGKRLGIEDERWLWDDVARAVGELRPGLVVLENVRGLLSAGGGRLFGRVLGTLADLGYDASWHGLRAADVGAPHGRWRVFIVATPADTQRGGRIWGPREPLGSAVPRAAAERRAPSPLLPTPAVNDMGNGKTVEAWDEWTAKMKAKHGNGNGHGKSLAIELQRVEFGYGPYAPAVARWERVLGRPAPAPSDDTRVREWMQGLPAGWITDVPGITRSEARKLAGNGVVPQQAEAALRFLLTVTEVAA